MRGRVGSCLFLLSLVACGEGVYVDLGDEDAPGDMSPGAPSTSPAPDMAPQDAPPDLSDAPDEAPELPPQDQPADLPVDPPPVATPLYTAGLTHSPINAHVAARLNAARARGGSAQDDVFIKVGDSNTVNTNFLHCLAGEQVELPDVPALDETWRYFQGGDIAGVAPYARVSLAASVGWSASGALAGSPSPLERELSAASARVALVQFGTNDIENRRIFSYGEQMTTIVDTLLGRGVIPILTSIAPRLDDADADLWVPRYNAAMRALAYSRAVPFIDLHQELVPLPSSGLGGDGLHLNAHTSGARACMLVGEGLSRGQNMRNLLTLQALTRLRRVLLDGAPPEPDAPALRGVGTSAEPFEIPALPFVGAGDTRDSAQSSFDVYDGCAASQDESGPELVYTFTLEAPATIRAQVFDPAGVDVDLHVLDSSGAPAGCLARAHEDARVALEAGTYFLVVDTFVSSAGQARSGAFFFTLLFD